MFTMFIFTFFPYTLIIKNKGCEKMLDYSPLWKTMQEKGISQYQLLQHGIDNKTLDGLKHNRNITLLTLEKLCMILNCTPNDIIEFR